MSQSYLLSARQKGSRFQPPCPWQRTFGSDFTSYAPVSAEHRDVKFVLEYRRLGKSAKRSVMDYVSSPKDATRDAVRNSITASLR